MKEMAKMLGVLLVLTVPVAGSLAAPLPYAHYRFDGDLLDSVDGSAAAAYNVSGSAINSVDKLVGSGCLDTDDRDGNGARWAAISGESSRIHMKKVGTIGLWVKITEIVYPNYGAARAFAFMAGLGLKPKSSINGWELVNTGFGNFDIPSSVSYDWQFWAITADGNNFRVYVGTKEGDSWTLSEKVNQPVGSGAFDLNYGNPLVLGANYTWGDGWNSVYEMFDEVRFWDVGLSASEVQEVFQSDIPEPATLALLIMGGLGIVARRRS